MTDKSDCLSVNWIERLNASSREVAIRMICDVLNKNLTIKQVGELRFLMWETLKRQCLGMRTRCCMLNTTPNQTTSLTRAYVQMSPLMSLWQDKYC